MTTSLKCRVIKVSTTSKGLMLAGHVSPPRYSKRGAHTPRLSHTATSSRSVHEAGSSMWWKMWPSRTFLWPTCPKEHKYSPVKTQSHEFTLGWLLFSPKLGSCCTLQPLGRKQSLNPLCFSRAQVLTQTQTLRRDFCRKSHPCTKETSK